jgi:hypothetical protein
MTNNSLVDTPEAQLRPLSHIEELKAKAAQASNRASELFDLLYPADTLQPEPSPDDFVSDTTDAWQAELEAMQAEYETAIAQEASQDRAIMKAELAVHQLRALHFRRLAEQEKELAEGKVQYPETEFLVDGWLPTKEIHLLVGESGAGKTTWLFAEFLSKWQREEPILGHASHYVPYAVLVNDRSKEGIVRTLKRIGLHPAAFPIVSINDNPAQLADKVEQFCDANKQVRFLVIEGIQCGMNEINDYSEVSKAMSRLIKLCRERDLTIFGTTHVSKAAASNGANGRTAAIGSVATAGMSETLFVMTRKGGRIEFKVNDHNGPEFVQNYRMTADGRLAEAEATPEGFDESRIAEFLRKQETGTFKRDEYIAFCLEKKKSIPTADRDLKDAKEAELIALCKDDRTGKDIPGFYQILKHPAGWEGLVMENG